MRKTRLVDCNPNFVEAGGKDTAIRFDCPEGHVDCIHVIPFTPTLDGGDGRAAWGSGGSMWSRTGDTFETLSLSPSIARRQRYPSKEAALADGVKPEYFEETLTCALHIFVTNGEIVFCGDSK